MVSISLEITEEDFRNLQWIVDNLCEELPDVNNPRHLVAMMIKDFTRMAREAKK